MDHSYRHVHGEVDGNSINGNATNLPPALGGQSQRNNNNNRRGRFQRGGRQFQNQRGPQTLAPPAFHQSVEPLAPSAAAVDAPTRIFIFVDDLFFVSKIQETARKLNVKVEFVKNYEDLLARMDAEPELKPSLVIFDLNNAAAKPLTAIPKLRARLKKSASLLGFLSHLQGELKLKAIEAGCDSVVPRSAFSQNLPQILRRHGAGDEQEVTQ
jgi:ActR/RegA family two-component response regulator